MATKQMWTAVVLAARSGNIDTSSHRVQTSYACTYPLFMRSRCAWNYACINATDCMPGMSCGKPLATTGMLWSATSQVSLQGCKSLKSHKQFRRSLCCHLCRTAQAMCYLSSQARLNCNLRMCNPNLSTLVSCMAT